jgi:L-cystine uptake protein TcyP (sodium:dicarboxylate symporter family)
LTLHIAGVFVLLLVEVVALRWVHPAAFLVLAFMGIPLALLGIVIYLYSLVSLGSLANRNDPAAISAKTVAKAWLN